MTAQYVEYITVDGDRLDLIAYRSYGDARAWEPIIEANPTLPLLSAFGPGLRLRVPILSLRNSDVARPTLPPWKST